MGIITETKEEDKREQEIEEKDPYLDKVYEEDLRDMLKRCYQCGRCSGVCQLSKVQKFTPSKIIQMILEGFEDKVIKSGVLWDCISCNTCLQYCPEDINFADIVRVAKYKMRKLTNQNPDEYIAHKGVYTTISEIMSQPNITPERNLDWVPNEAEISNKGNILYYVGCIPYFQFEFQGLDSIPTNTLKLLYKIENEPIVVMKDEFCCGHDIYWGQGKLNEFINLAKKNIEAFESTGVSTIVTACAECYRTLKVDYPNLFEDFNEKYNVQHIIEYIYDKWKQGKVEFKKPEEQGEETQFTYHDPCRLSRFLPKDNNIMDNVREIFAELKELGYTFNEMAHNKENSLCCGVSSWMNCNEKSKALRYKRMLEANSAGTVMVTSCPKCRIHLSCIQNDYDNLASTEILDFSEFIGDLVKIVNLEENSEVKE
ncbi:MAG: (Fe-S)-binding protein [Promethearchaeota archaeon]